MTPAGRREADDPRAERRTAAVPQRSPAGMGGSLIPLPVRRAAFVEDIEQPLPSLLRREAHRPPAARRVRRAGGDARAHARAGVARPGPVVARGRSPACRSSWSLFKIAGLYDRDQLRIVRSTLDEGPMVFQLTGLYALGVAILHPVLAGESLGGGEIAGLWLVSLVAVMGGRMTARWLGGQIAPPERCLVIGGAERSDRIRQKLASSRARASVVATLPAPERRDRVGRQPREPAAAGHRPPGPPHHHRPGDRRGGRRRRADPGRQGGRRPRERPAPHARGGRLRGRVRGRRRPDDARSPPVRPPALVAPAQARLRPRRHDDRPRRREPDPGGGRRWPSGSTPRARSSSGRCASAATAGTSRSSSSARWSSTPTPTRTACATSTRSATACSRSPTTRGSRASATSSAARRWTSCRSCSTSCAAT